MLVIIGRFVYWFGCSLLLFNYFLNFFILIIKKNFIIITFLFYFFFWLRQEAQSPNHWTAREFPYFIKYFLPQFHPTAFAGSGPSLSLSHMLAAGWSLWVIIRDCLASGSWSLAGGLAGLAKYPAHSCLAPTLWDPQSTTGFQLTGTCIHWTAMTGKFG